MILILIDDIDLILIINPLSVLDEQCFGNKIYYYKGHVTLMDLSHIY
jgi:hypothetical protein